MANVGSPHWQRLEFNAPPPLNTNKTRAVDVTKNSWTYCMQPGLARTVPRATCTTSRWKASFSALWSATSRCTRSSWHVIIWATTQHSSARPTGPQLVAARWRAPWRKTSYTAGSLSYPALSISTPPASTFSLVQTATLWTMRTSSAA